VLVAPDLPTACDDVPDLLDSRVRNGLRHLPRGQLELRETRGVRQQAQRPYGRPVGGGHFARVVSPCRGEFDGQSCSSSRNAFVSGLRNPFGAGVDAGAVPADRLAGSTWRKGGSGPSSLRPAEAGPASAALTSRR